jgi:release factor glutamine methyltransferase
LSLEAVAERLRAAGCVFAEDEARLLLAQADTAEELAELTGRRCAGVPLEHLLGWASFRGLRLAIAEGVFVPRPRTEFLVDCALAGLSPGARVLDLCCGCGAIAAAVLAQRADVITHAVDIEPCAVVCARRNLEPLGGRVYHGDLYAPLPVGLRAAVDVIIANAPYVPTEQICMLPVESRLYEPRQALDGGADGLEVQRRIVGDAADWLRPGGRLLLETSERQADTVVAALEAARFSSTVVRDEDRNATVVVAQAERPPATTQPWAPPEA